MARADLLIELVRHAYSGNKAMFRKVVEAIIAEERKKNHTILAKQLESVIYNQTSVQSNGKIISDNRIEQYIHEIVPEISLEDLILPSEIIEICKEITQEQHRVDLLRSYSLEPRNKLLFIGPPGNGKTSLAEALADLLMIPLYIVRYESIIGTYLGETAARLKKLFDFVKTRNCVLFFDEFETLGKERGDTHETGEIKRVVSSLLMQIDGLPSHVIVIAATNHPELLDRAVWRRFQIRINLPQPTRNRIEEWFRSFEIKHNFTLGYAPSTLAKKMLGSNFAEIEEFGISILRKYVLSHPNADVNNIVKKELEIFHKRNVKVEP